MSEYSEYYERDGIEVTRVQASEDGTETPENKISAAVSEYLHAERNLEYRLSDMSKTELRLLRQVVRGFNRYIGLCLDMKED